MADASAQHTEPEPDALPCDEQLNAMLDKARRYLTTAEIAKIGVEDATDRRTIRKYLGDCHEPGKGYSVALLRERRRRLNEERDKLPHAWQEDLQTYFEARRPIVRSSTPNRHAASDGNSRATPNGARKEAAHSDYPDPTIDDVVPFERLRRVWERLDLLRDLASSHRRAEANAALHCLNALHREAAERAERALIVLAAYFGPITVSSAPDSGVRAIELWLNPERIELYRRKFAARRAEPSKRRTGKRCGFVPLPEVDSAPLEIRQLRVKLLVSPVDGSAGARAAERHHPTLFGTPPFHESATSRLRSLWHLTSAGCVALSGGRAAERDANSEARMLLDDALEQYQRPANLAALLSLLPIDRVTPEQQMLRKEVSRLREQEKQAPQKNESP